MEFKTAMAKAIDEADTCLTLKILTREDNLVFHSEWDNLNKILTNVTGWNVVNSVVRIMLQEKRKEILPSSKQPQPMLDRTKEQNLKTNCPSTKSTVI